MSKPSTSGMPPGKPPPAPPSRAAPSRYARKASAFFSSKPSFDASSPNSSYILRLLGSESTSKAALTCLNFSSADLLPGFTSGWYLRASLRNAFLISSSPAPRETPRAGSSRPPWSRGDNLTCPAERPCDPADRVAGSSWLSVLWAAPGRRGRGSSTAWRRWWTGGGAQLEPAGFEARVMLVQRGGVGAATRRSMRDHPERAGAGHRPAAAATPRRTAQSFPAERSEVDQRLRTFGSASSAAAC